MYIVILRYYGYFFIQTSPYFRIKFYNSVKSLITIILLDIELITKVQC